ncbi:MAG: universal stress protein [Actinomycetota bacterium]|nr:universal stress protein [Actinomycetota bacterium]
MANTAPFGEPPRSGAFRRILVGFDGSNAAHDALRTAIALAADLRGEAHVLLVVRPPAHSETEEEALRAAEAERENLSQGLAQVPTPDQVEVSTEVLYADDPGRAMAAYAAEHGFDIVVVGGHGREQVMHRGIGQSLEGLLRHHPCPVLVV